MYLSNIANTYDNRIGVRIFLQSKRGGDPALEQLSADREAIEREIGQPLQRNPNPDNKDKIIAINRSADLSDRKQWSKHIDWMLDMTKRCHKTFGPRVNKLDLTRPVEIPESESVDEP